MNHGGYIKLWRQIQHSPIWQDSIGVHVFVALLLRAVARPRKTLLKVRIESVVVMLHAGQTAIRLRLFADDIGVAVNTLRAKLKLLEDLGYIQSHPTSKFVLVTIPNWDKYQTRQKVVEGVSMVDTPSDTPSDTHSKKTKKTKKSVARTPFVKPTVEEVREYAASIGYRLDAEYFILKNDTDGWMQGTKENRRPIVNWKLTVQTWRRTEDRNGNGKTQTLEDLYPDLTKRGARQ